MSRTDLRPRVLAALALAIACLAGCHEETYRFEDLGVPRTARTPQARAVLDGKLLVTLFETNGEGRLAIVDLVTGTQDELALPGARGADAIAVDAGRHVAYVGTSTRAAVYQVEVATGKVSPLHALDPFLVREGYVWSLAVAPSGEVFAGTYPGGLLLAYEPRGGGARTLGAPLPGRQYVRQLLVAPSGTVYCGLGTPAAIAAVDPRSGRSRVLASAATGDVAFPSNLRLEGGRVLAALGATELRTPRLENPADVLQPEIDIDPDGRYVVRVGPDERRGRLDLSSRQNGMGVMGLSSGPDGDVYGATYYNASLFRIDPGRGVMESVGRVKDAVGEFRVLCPMGRRVFLPGYAGALYVYDVDRPWDAHGTSANPWRLGEIGHGQHLATAAAADGDELAIATPPAYGLRGGALTLLDTRSLSWRTFPNLVPDQSFTAVSLRGGTVYGGTSVEVGLGETVRARSAHIVVVDARTGTVRRDIVVADATAITSLVQLGPDRLLAGTDRGDLLELEATTGRTRVVARLPHIRQLWPWPERNLVIGIGWRRGLFLVEPRSLAVRWIEGAPDKLVPGMAADSRGRVYLHDGTRVYRMTSG
ncbi:MAG TPA: hypothetical protein VIK51_22960 [Vicinamibacteria bacterium]